MNAILSEYYPALNEILWLKYVITFLLITLRYVIFAGAAYLIFYVWKRRDWFYRNIQQKYPESKRIWHEVKYSLSSFLIIAGLITLTSLAYNAGITQLYTELLEKGWVYFGFSIIAAIFIHDTYFYWTHRAMHHPKVFKHVHKVHHRSHNPTPWASFSFHPIEAVIEFGFVPIMVMVLPLHPLALLLFSFYMMALNVMGHLSFEIFPRRFSDHWLFKFQNTPTHHNMHHKMVNCNYGLYFNIWDRVMGTNHKKYKATFDEVTSRPKPDKEPLVELAPIHSKQ